MGLAFVTLREGQFILRWQRVPRRHFRKDEQPSWGSLVSSLVAYWMLLCPSWKFPDMNHSINQLNQSNKEYDGLQSWTNLTENSDPIQPPPPHPPDQGCENGAISLSHGFNPSSIVELWRSRWCFRVRALNTGQSNKQTNTGTVKLGKSWVLNKFSSSLQSNLY